MEKIDLKHTTKEALYGMLKDADSRAEAYRGLYTAAAAQVTASERALEEAKAAFAQEEKRSRTLKASNEDLLSRVGAQEEQLSGAYENVNALERDVQGMREVFADMEMEMAEEKRRLEGRIEQYRSSYRWCINHPWRNLLEWIRRKLRAL